MMNWDETGGWIFSDDGHGWMSENMGSVHVGEGLFFTLKPDGKERPGACEWDEPALAQWDHVCRWPVPFEEHDLENRHRWT